MTSIIKASRPGLNSGMATGSGARKMTFSVFAETNARKNESVTRNERLQGFIVELESRIGS